MISAFKVLYDSGQKDYRFVLVVTHKQKDSNEIQRLNQEIKNYPIELLTETSHDRLVSLYKQAKIYWHAAGFQEDLGTHPERAEHFGISTVEAMSAGVVPVVINAGGLSEIVTNEKDGFLWNSESELLQKTSDIIKDDFLRERMANAAIERAKAFTQDMFCNRINQIVL
jgi:glycosyltransferase involved in cell wall biosynthesis